MSLVAVAVYVADDRRFQSHFLKVPSLPFHSLMSILCKFPTDDDSRVFWSGSLRDTLYGESHGLTSSN